MIQKILGFGLLAAFLSVGISHAVADETADETEFGKLWVDSNLKHVRVEIDGRVHDEVEYDRGGKRAVIDDLVFSKLPLKITLVPRVSGYVPLTIEVVRADFKRSREGKSYLWLAKKKVKFAKAKKTRTKPKKPKKKPKKPAEKPEDDEL